MEVARQQAIREFSQEETVLKSIQMASGNSLKKTYLARRRRIGRRRVNKTQAKNKIHDLSTVVKQVIDLQKEKEKTCPRVFLSHSWTRDSLDRENHKRVAELDKALRSRGIDTWLDEKDLNGHIVKSMCDGIDGCDIVLVCICRHYIDKCVSSDNQNCRLELDYSFERKGGQRLIAVVMDPDCRSTKSWNGPVGAYLGRHLYFDLSDDSFKNIDKLVNEINRVKNI